MGLGLGVWQMLLLLLLLRMMLAELKVGCWRLGRVKHVDRHHCASEGLLLLLLLLPLRRSRSQGREGASKGQQLRTSLPVPVLPL